jgi:predicted alpha/beta superfamily hydrolase
MDTVVMHCVDFNVTLSGFSVHPSETFILVSFWHWHFFSKYLRQFILIKSFAMLSRSLLILRGIILVLCNVSFVVLYAQDLPGKKDSLESGILKEKRIIQVVMPANYKPGMQDKFDVLYVLDGEGNTKLTEDIIQFISGEGFMPQPIIVGVFNTDRTRDLTPSHEQGFESSGGADHFLAFLKNELIPYINAKYPTNGDNMLFGHSFGALFVMYALLQEPNLFKSYLAADPSFWWGNGSMEKLAKEKLQTLSGSPRTLFISGREGQGMREMRILPMDTILQKWAPAGLAWKVAAYPNETHGTVRLKSIYDGLKFTYTGYSGNSVVVHPMGGIVLPGRPFKIWYFEDTSGVRYTTDGTEPTLSSPLIQQEITLPGPGVFSAKRFANRDRYNKITRIDFHSGKPWIPVAKTKNAKPGGLHYAYYEGQWDSLPDFKTLQPVSAGKADSSFDLNKLPRKDNFGLVMEGQVQIAEEGYYIFGLSSDDGSRLYLNGQLLIDDDGLHGVVDKSYIVPLQRGFYPLRLEYFQKGGDRVLRLVYLTPAAIQAGHPRPIQIPFSAQYTN